MENGKEYIVFSGGTKESFELIASDLLYLEQVGLYEEGLPGEGIQRVIFTNNI